MEITALSHAQRRYTDVIGIYLGMSVLPDGSAHNAQLVACYSVNINDINKTFQALQIIVKAANDDYDILNDKQGRNIWADCQTRSALCCVFMFSSRLGMSK